MEELWKKHRNKIKDHLFSINEFLETELNETKKPNETFETNEKSKEKIQNNVQQIQTNIILDEKIEITDENKIKKRGRPRSQRKEIYGKLRDIVKYLMEKENISRAQAYRRAKKIHKEKNNK